VACVQAGVVYALSAFSIGFLLGAIRVTLVAPRVGETLAVLLEAPLMLAVSWKLSRWSAGRFGVLSHFNDALLMGVISFATLMSAEIVTAVLFFGRSVQSYFDGFASAAGMIGLLAQVCFAAFPVVQAGCGRGAVGE
jgi:hypothetical protein